MLPGEWEQAGFEEDFDVTAYGDSKVYARVKREPVSKSLEQHAGRHVIGDMTIVGIGPLAVRKIRNVRFEFKR